MYFKLDENNKVIPAKDYKEWGEIFGTDRARVGWDEVNGITISTVFLGLDLGFHKDEPPLVFETMMFSDNPDFNEYQTRCSTWEEAQNEHIFCLNCAKLLTPVMGRKILKIKL